MLNWIWEGSGPARGQGVVHVMRQTYSGACWRADGSVTAVHGRRLSDGTWWQVHYWRPRV